MPADGVANRTYPQYVPPPDRAPGSPGSHESVRYIEMPQVGLGTGDGGHKVGDERPVVTDPTIGAAPVDSVPSPDAPKIDAGQDSVFTLVDVDSAVTRSANSAAPEYPPALLAQHVMGYVSARYIVDTTGFADSSSFEVIESTNPEFVKAVRAALPGMRFKPAKIGQLKVRQLVEQMFSFKIDDSALPAAAAGAGKNGRKPPATPPR
jgi:hypothetical protein